MLHFNTDKHNVTTVIAENNKQYKNYIDRSKEPKRVEKKEYTDYLNDISTLTTASKSEIIVDLIKNKYKFINELQKVNIDRIKFISFKTHKISKMVKGFKSSCKTISVKVIYNDKTFEFINYKK